MHVTTDDAVRIAYDREGAGGRPLVLVGGLGQMRGTDPATRTLTSELAARGLDVVHPDRPGRGDSGDGPATLAGEVAAIRALVDELGGRAALYGRSSGGAIALAAAADLPGVDRLVLWEVPLGTSALPDATRAEVPGAEHGWAPAGLADVVVTAMG